MDRLQTRRMTKKNELMPVLDHMFRHEHPKATSVPRGEKVMDVMNHA